MEEMTWSWTAFTSPQRRWGDRAREAKLGERSGIPHCAPAQTGKRAATTNYRSRVALHVARRW